MTKVKELNFSGTTIFCGLDVHKASWRENLRGCELELKDFTKPAGGKTTLAKVQSLQTQLCGLIKTTIDKPNTSQNIGS